MEQSAAVSTYNIYVIAVLLLLLIITVVLLFITWKNQRVLSEKLKRNNDERDFNERLIRVTIESQENERKRFAKDLHDEVGLTLQALNFTVARTANETDRKQVQQLVNEFTETVRRISWDLMPSSLERFGLMEALDELCARINERSSISVTLERAEGRPTLDKTQEILLYRIVQEAINNALKHAKATEIKIQTEIAKGFFIRVKDNGVGFELPASAQFMPNQYGLGIHSMESRARLMHGSVNFEKNNPKGTQVIIQIPLHGSA